jgi:hypothetical protein
MLIEDRQEMVENFWEGLASRLAIRGSGIRFDNPSKLQIAPGGRGKSWQFKQYPIVGRSGFRLAFLIDTSENKAGVHIVVNKPLRDVYSQLYAQRERINVELGVEEAEWQLKPNDAHRVEVLRDFHLANRESWEEIYDWLFKTFETFHKVFSPKIESLGR